MTDILRQAYKRGVGVLPPRVRNVGRRVAQRTGLNRFLPESNPYRKFLQVFEYLDNSKLNKLNWKSSVQRAVEFLERERGTFDVDGWFTPLEDDIDTGQPHDGYTLLTFAVRNNQEPAVRALLASGANPRKQDRNGKTPLFMAILNNHANQIKHEIKEYEYMNNSPLIIPDDRNEGIIQALFDAGASPNDTLATRIGPVPVICWVIRYRNIPLLRLFAQRGANLNILLPTRESLLDYAEADVRQDRHPEILDVLRELGAQTAAQIRAGIQYPRGPPRVLPRNATNVVSFADIEDGTPMANFDNEFQYGRFYTEESFRSLPQMLNPFTRRPINQRSVQLYTAEIPPAENENANPNVGANEDPNRGPNAERVPTGDPAGPANLGGAPQADIIQALHRQNAPAAGINEATYQRWLPWLGPEPRRLPTLIGAQQMRDFAEAQRLHRERNPNLYRDNRAVGGKQKKTRKGRKGKKGTRRH